MRVISMVPSWTETLIACGVEVVGRTRFCIHPDGQVKNIPAVGGTKDIRWEKVAGLKADILILDQEENPKVMAEKSPIPYFASHIKKVSDVERDLESMGQLFRNQAMADLARRWRIVSQAPLKKTIWEEVPGILEWIKKPDHQTSLIYLIWHHPWMAVSRNTFIGSVLEKVVGPDRLTEFKTPYPELDLTQFDPEQTVLFFSTEPFPFAKKKNLITGLPFSSAIVDGEAYSWFGLRTLQFLEKHLL